MSITASWLVLAVVLLRLALKKAPKWLMGVLWAFVGIRLISPFSIESVFSLIPSTETLPNDILVTDTPAINSGIPYFNQTVNPIISNSLSPNIGDSVNPMQVIIFAASVIWIVGIVAMLVYTLVSFWKIKRKVNEAVFLKDNIWVCDHIPSPFILGVIRPKIYLPSSMNKEDTEYVISHEKAHFKRHDHWWKPLGFLLLAIHWFNPILWVGYILLCRDIELACDEKVIKEMGVENKKMYSDALINCSIHRRTIAACPLAFGEVGVKERVKNVLSYKKPAFWIIIVAVVAIIVAAVCLLTNPVGTDIDDQLKVFLDMRIAEHHESEHTGDNFISIDYKILKTKATPKETTVYMWVLYEEYSYNGELKVEAGAHTPTVITATKTDGHYELKEYWTPRDGSYYSEDIKAKFPIYLWNKALDSQKYVDEQSANCLKNAQEYYEITISNVGGVDNPTNVSTQEGFNPYFNATVLEVYEGSVVVEPFEGTEERKSSDKISVSLNVISTNPVPSIKVGDRIRVVYNGEIAESYPAQINKVFAIYALDEKGNVVLQETLTENTRYSFKDSVDPIDPTIILSQKEQRFQFTYSALSSYIAVGTYELTDSELTLKTDDGNNTYVFTIAGNTFIFNSKKSTAIPKYKHSSDGTVQSPVPDGATFSK